METYPSIPAEILRVPCYAFDKLDGNNVRAEWTRKGGFGKFGTRTRLLDETDPLVGGALPLFWATQAEALDRVFRKQRWERATAFLEYWGPGSFAGQHVPGDAMRLTLLDVHRYKHGILEPREFLRLFGDGPDTASLLYRGNPTEAFVRSVRAGSLEGMTFEGVVCKAGRDSRNRLMMFKVKSDAWIERLRAYCRGDDTLFRELV